MGNIEKGRKGEEQARNYLAAAGVHILGTNLQTEYGEIDILGELDDTLIFFEVKTRHGNSFGEPESAIDRRKKEHMIQSAQSYIMHNFESDPNWRIDVIAIQKISGNPTEIKWFKNAVIE